MGLLVDVAGPQSSWQTGPAWLCVLESVRFMCALCKKESLFPPGLWFFWKSHWPAKPHFLWVHFPSALPWGWETNAGLRDLPLGESICHYNNPLICGSSTRGMGLDSACAPHLPIHLAVVLLLHLQLHKIFSANPSGLSHPFSCPVNSYNLCAPRGGEPKALPAMLLTSHQSLFLYKTLKVIKMMLGINSIISLIPSVTLIIIFRLKKRQIMEFINHFS